MYRKPKNSRIIKINKNNKKNNNLKLFGGTNKHQESKDNFYSILDSEEEFIHNQQERMNKIREKFALYDDKEAAYKAAYGAIIDNEDRKAASKAASDAMNALNLRGQLLSNLGKKSLEMLLADLEKERANIESIINKILMELDKKQAEEIANAAILDDKDREDASYAAYNAKLAESDKLAAFNAANDALMEIKKQKRLKKRNKIAKKNKLSKDIIEQKEDLQNQIGVIESKEDEYDYAMQWENNIEDKISDYMNKYPILRISAIKMAQQDLITNNSYQIDYMNIRIIQIDDIMQKDGVSWTVAEKIHDNPNMSEKEKKQLIQHGQTLGSVMVGDTVGDSESSIPQINESDKNIHNLMRKYKISRKTAKLFHENHDLSEDEKKQIINKEDIYSQERNKELQQMAKEELDSWKINLSEKEKAEKYRSIFVLMKQLHCSFDTAFFVLTNPNISNEELDNLIKNDKVFQEYNKKQLEEHIKLEQEKTIKLMAAQKKAKSKERRRLLRKRK
tara:strand:+ start:50 stop:1567 length:1518 start_codon:yes stop_codon:yes gene_type:complete